MIGSSLGAVACSRSEFGTRLIFGHSGMFSLSSRLDQKILFSSSNIIGLGYLAIYVISFSKMTS